MKKATEVSTGEGEPGDGYGIESYSLAQTPAFRAICDELRRVIDTALPKATSKVWHGIPVWFIEDNPVVGYKAASKVVNLMFWNGQAFDEPLLKPLGKHRAAQFGIADATEIELKAITRWLKKAKTDILDAKAYFERLRAGE